MIKNFHRCPNKTCKGLFQYTIKTKMLLATKSNVFREVFNYFSLNNNTYCISGIEIVAYEYFRAAYL